MTQRNAGQPPTQVGQDPPPHPLRHDCDVARHRQDPNPQSGFGFFVFRGCSGLSDAGRPDQQHVGGGSSGIPTDTRDETDVGVGLSILNRRLHSVRIRQPTPADMTEYRQASIQRLPSGRDSRRFQESFSAS